MNLSNGAKGTARLFLPPPPPPAPAARAIVSASGSGSRSTCDTAPFPPPTPSVFCTHCRLATCHARAVPSSDAETRTDESAVTARLVTAFSWPCSSCSPPAPPVFPPPPPPPLPPSGSRSPHEQS